METSLGFVDSSGIKIHYERTGRGKHPFILCHGITDNGRCMLRLAEHLSPNYNVFLVDARGHGLSDAPEYGYSSDHHADDLYNLIDNLGLKNPIIYGHSMGARTTVRLAAKYPDLPLAIILEDPVNIIPLSDSEKTEHAQWLANLSDEIRFRKTLSEAERLKIAEAQNHPDWTKSEQIEWAKSKAQVSPNVVMVGKSMASITDDFPNITCSVLILKADADLEIQRKNEASTKLIPRGKIIHVAGAGHNIRREKWRETIHHLDEFLSSI